MSIAYVDTSCLVAIAFGERQGAAIKKALAGFDELVSSNLLEAELRSAFSREATAFAPELLSWISWVLPDRPLGPEVDRVLTTGYVRGADAWHIACALYVASDPSQIAFLTLDTAQRTVATALGFGV